MLFVSISVLAVRFIIGHDVTVLFSPMALRTWLDAGAVLNQLICASDRVHRDPFHTRSVGTEVSAAAAVSLQAHRPFAFTHICSSCLLHHGNSAIPQGFCCARPSLCGQFRTNHLLLVASHESILSGMLSVPTATSENVWLTCVVLPPQSGEAEGHRCFLAFIRSCPPQCYTLLQHSFHPTTSQLFSDVGVWMDPFDVSSSFWWTSRSEPFMGSLNCSSPSLTSYRDGGDFRC